jgi:hypothetical protein
MIQAGFEQSAGKQWSVDPIDQFNSETPTEQRMITEIRGRLAHLTMAANQGKMPI